MRGTVEQLTVEDWDRGMNTNLRGMFLMAKYVVPHMRERKYGRIVNVASVNAVIADKMQPLPATYIMPLKPVYEGLP